MTFYLLLFSVIMIICIISNRFSSKLGIPALLVFMAVGMLFGSDGILKIPFENYSFAEQICSVALIFIIFYGGFGTNWQRAKPVALKAGLLSSAGVLITAALTGLFCYLVLGTELLESLLIGSVISSTDAASVFYILRSKKLNLKYNTASLLEIESGSNDPFSYMLTIIILTLMEGDIGVKNTLYMMFAQIVFGVSIGVLLALAAMWVLKRFQFTTEGFDTVFVLSIAVLAYALANISGGNGYLSVYIAGIILGNCKLVNKASLVHFFDGVTGMMQMLIFFLLGLLSFPSQMPGILLISFLIALFLTLVARPAAVFAIMSPMRCPINQQLLVSWAGLRGASSIVFAIMATISSAYTKNDVFHIVFCVVLMSVSIQGTLLALVAKKLKMIDNNENVFRTFNDYQEEKSMQFIKVTIPDNHIWANKKIKDIILPPQTLLTVMYRDDKAVIPKGNTVIKTGDTAVLGAFAYDDKHNTLLEEIVIDKFHEWNNKRISELKTSEKYLIAMIKRQNDIIIPKGNTQITEGDILVLIEEK